MKFPFTKNEIFFAAVYFVQAAVGISALAQFLFTRNELGLSFIELGILAALPTISWSIKPIYGFLTDLVPIYGYRRRPYLHIMPLITMLSWLWIWQFADSFISYAIPIMIANIGLGFTDVIADGLVVQQSDEKTAGRYQSICWGSLTVGAIITTFLSGLLIGRDIVSIKGMFLITALIPLITFTLSFFIKERRISDRSELKTHKAISPSYIYTAVLAFIVTIVLLSPYEGQNMATASFGVIGIWFVWFGGYFKHLMDIKIIGKSIFAAAIFIFFWRFTPSFGAPWSDYLLNQVGVDQETFGYFGVVSYIGWLIGSILFAKYFDKFNLKKVLLWTIVLSAILGLSQLGLTKIELGNAIGSNVIIKYVGAVISAPVFLIAQGRDFWTHLMQYDGLIFLNFFLDFFLGILYMISFLALLKFVALSTPRNLEGTNFAVFASIMNFGLVFGSISGGYIYEHIQHGMFGINGLQITVLLGAITSLIALIVLPWIKTDHMAHES
ncbi:MFS transporter [Patescibacteria group bacterium]|nr:MFS transporter [Patescibacteria group bacterium]MBU1683386.1 MFS transporter [Patescibacteria group bacterium]